MRATRHASLSVLCQELGHGRDQLPTQSHPSPRQHHRRGEGCRMLALPAVLWVQCHRLVEHGKRRRQVRNPASNVQRPTILRQEDCALGRGDSAHGSGLEHGGHALILGTTWGGRSKGAGGPSTWSLQLRLLPFLVGRGGCHLLPTLPLIDTRVPISLTEGGMQYCGCSVQRPGRGWRRGASCCWGESCSEN